MVARPRCTPDGSYDPFATVGRLSSSSTPDSHLSGISRLPTKLLDLVVSPTFMANNLNQGD